MPTVAPAYNPHYSATAHTQPPPNHMYTATTGTTPAAAGGTPPKKYIKINGITKLNPEYRQWKEQTQANGQPGTTVANPSIALPIVSSMEDHENYCQASIAAGGIDVPLAESTSATIEMMQEPEISLEAGMQPDEMVDQLGAVMNKYECPMGLMNKLMVLSEFDVLEFMVDDSGSMTMVSDTVSVEGRPQTRWEEAKRRLKEMVEVLAYVPFQEIQVCFLNRRERVSMTRNGRNPQAFLMHAYQQIDQVFNMAGPTGSTPFLQRLRESFQQFGPGKQVARYFFGDGVPDGGLPAKAEIVRLLMNRQNPEGNPMTFLSCTGDDAQVEWMKDAEEVVPYCAECDDFKDESAEVYKDQGDALPFSFGFYLICTLVAAMNPDDLDAMDESVPFTKMTLDNLLGVENNEEMYRHYFNHFVAAQRARPVENDDYGRPKKNDQLKKSVNWEALYQDFLRAPVAKDIPAVQQFKRQLAE